jgi:hypothetical protein
MYYALNGEQRAWLIGLLILWAALLFGGFIGGKLHAAGASRMLAWTRILSSLVLVIAAWSWFLLTRQTGGRNFALLIAIGMSLGFLGDLFMGGWLPAPDRVIAGMAAFGLGHITYIAAGISMWGKSGLDAPAPRILAWAAWLLVAGVLWYAMIYRGAADAPLVWVALPYALLLASTAGVATGLALQSPAFLPFALGAALFLISDLMIAGRLFAGLTSPAIDDAIWLTYGPGQMLIVYSIGAARIIA